MSDTTLLRRSVAGAVFVELPIAVVCFWMAWCVERVLVRRVCGVGVLCREGLGADALEFRSTAGGYLHFAHDREEIEMPESARDVKGQAKERIGRVADDQRLERDGQVEQAGEHVKKGVDKVVDKAKDALRRR